MVRETGASSGRVRVGRGGGVIMRAGRGEGAGGDKATEGIEVVVVVWLDVCGVRCG